MEDIEEIKKQISELQIKIDKLENEKKKENKENKRWRAKVGDKYCCVDIDGEVVCVYENGDSIDNFRYKTRNYFKTEGEAQKYADVKLTYYDLMDLAEELNNGEKIDWNDNQQCKYTIYYSLKCDTLDEGIAYVCKELGQIYCLDEDF